VHDFPSDITNPAAYDAWVDEMESRACKCDGTCPECERESAARRRNIASTIDRDREDRARRGLPASRLDASLAANVHDAIDRKPSLGAMLRIAEQREDERALGKLERDMEAMP
jgi:hypothetical protein